MLLVGEKENILLHICGLDPGASLAMRQPSQDRAKAPYYYDCYTWYPLQGKTCRNCCEMLPRQAGGLAPVPPPSAKRAACFRTCSRLEGLAYDLAYSLPTDSEAGTGWTARFSRLSPPKDLAQPITTAGSVFLEHFSGASA